MSNFWQRALTGTVFVAVIVFSIFSGEMVFQLLFLMISLFSLKEFYTLVGSPLVTIQKLPGLLLGGFTYLCIAPLTGAFLPIQKWIAVLYTLIVLIIIIELYRKKTFPFHNIAYVVSGVVYVVIPFALLAKLSIINTVYDYSIPLSIFLLIWTNDTFAYITGVKFGKHRLFVRISPKKSWEGSAGGLIFTLLVAYFLSKQFNVFATTEWMIIAAIVVVAGTLGDLVESMLKRSLQVKDSGNILPGHGGLLDRFDALLLAVPCIYIYLSLCS